MLVVGNVYHVRLPLVTRDHVAGKDLDRLGAGDWVVRQLKRQVAPLIVLDNHPLPTVPPPQDLGAMPAA